mmetsp:Transcript_15995/g.32797  ORF Transcript_15995/g.32797 Transcript_15995/m.32797 type:complete len:174 (-) Transcript_15995:201-722(-)|eukprot:CAMPEP_0201124700 /NCGR_PEP_ID=MMETSP0850-20130426/16592_1 /ASSEMBLY_ACC=CAM_ASM_000622 /TAXON_ID=183588 /ORGANISM="Pseudo-nitzschia fraudulenta, Strain WWA7" /LENGTH=173 /DNA_ID=CAMNT_0047392275 /DNA_START=292 /DNA_END=813 /DNA_ORIENTATION=-
MPTSYERKKTPSIRCRVPAGVNNNYNHNNYRNHFAAQENNVFRVAPNDGEPVSCRWFVCVPSRMLLFLTSHRADRSGVGENPAVISPIQPRPHECAFWQDFWVQEITSIFGVRSAVRHGLGSPLERRASDGKTIQCVVSLRYLMEEFVRLSPCFQHVHIGFRAQKDDVSRHKW